MPQSFNKSIAKAVIAPAAVRSPAQELAAVWSNRRTRRIRPGECYVTSKDETITTTLGSCIAACIRDGQAGIGGMNHFMLPEERVSSGNRWLDPSLGLPTRYGTHAMESLFNDLMSGGARRERLEIKLFGGGRIEAATTNVGDRNIEFIRRFLRVEGLKAVVEDLGGNQPRKLAYSPHTGQAWVQRLRPIESSLIAQREKVYMSKIGSHQKGGDVELFE